MATLLSGIQAIAKAAQQQQQQHQGTGEDTAGMDVSDGSARGVKRSEETEEEARRRISLARPLTQKFQTRAQPQESRRQSHQRLPWDEPSRSHSMHAAEILVGQ